MKTYTVEELKKILELHAKWLKGETSGERANLAEADLTKADLRGADLRGADLKGANLREANLAEANLRGAYLTRANLTRANLAEADLTEADLRGADLRGATGNNKEIKTIQADLWIINYTESVIQIGCKNYTIEEWFDFSDEIIKKMDAKALEFWKKWKPILELIGVFNKVKAAREAK